MALDKINFEPLSATFGARVNGVQLRDIDDDVFKEIYARWLDFGLLVFSGQFLSRTEQIELAKRFGKLEFDIAPLSNVLPDRTLRTDDGTDDMVKVLKGNMGWHHDSTYMPVQAKGAVFSAEVVPSRGGATGFADMRAAYDALDAGTLRTIKNLRAHHSLYHSQAKLGHEGKKGSHPDTAANMDKGYNGYGFHDGPISVRPLVKIHPETGRKNLLIGRHAYDIVGYNSAASARLLQALADFACQPPRTYHHQWTVGDAVIWDNRRLLHQATPWPMDQARIMWHSRIAGDPVTEAALAS